MMIIDDAVWINFKFDDRCTYPPEEESKGRKYLLILNNKDRLEITSDVWTGNGWRDVPPQNVKKWASFPLIRSGDIKVCDKVYIAATVSEVRHDGTIICCTSAGDFFGVEKSCVCKR